MSSKTCAASRSLELPQGRLEYLLRFSRRRSLSLYVFADGRLEVRAPLGCPEAQVEDFVRSRREWILRKQAEFASRPAPPRRLLRDGEPQLFLGEAYPLVLERGRPAGVWLAAGQLRVRSLREDQVAGQLADWYRRQAQRVFAERLAALAPLVERLGVAAPSLRVRAMRSRWGSCSRRGGITLNLELVRYPVTLIDYVLVHELCHLREFNHSPRFYALMDALLPDWPQRKAELAERAREMPVD